MGEWVLILTIATTQSAAIHSVSMYTFEACVSAGKEWAGGFKDNQTRSWICKPRS
jgi:hypothetical protein